MSQEGDMGDGEGGGVRFQANDILRVARVMGSAAPAGGVLARAVAVAVTPGGRVPVAAVKVARLAALDPPVDLPAAAGANFGFCLGRGSVAENVTRRWRAFWELGAAACAIQRAWRRRRAATRIQAAFRAWRWRRAVLWNPHTDVGRALALREFRALGAVGA